MVNIMSYSKKSEFDEKEIRLAEYAKALSHPARIAILMRLAERSTCICGEIVEVLPLAQSTVSQHLGELKKAGLVLGEIDGPRSCYYINREALAELGSLFGGLFNELGRERSASACCGILPKKKKTEKQ